MKYKLYYKGFAYNYYDGPHDADGNPTGKPREFITEEEAILMRLEFPDVTVEEIKDEI